MALIGSNQILTSPSGTIFTFTEQQFVDYTKKFVTNPDVTINDFGYKIIRQNFVKTRISFNFVWKLFLFNSKANELVTEVKQELNNFKTDLAPNLWLLQDNKIKSAATNRPNPSTNLVFNSHKIFVTSVDYEELNTSYGIVDLLATEVLT
jgi:hypothetical protein